MDRSQEEAPPMTNLLQLLCACMLIFTTVTAVAPDDPKKSDVKSEFFYPSADSHNGSFTGSVDAFVYNTVMTTKDDFDTVSAFYEKKTDKKLTALKPGSVGMRANSEGYLFMHDDSEATGADKPRAMSIRYLEQDTKVMHLTLVITRSKDESHTHIILTHVKKKPQS